MARQKLRITQQGYIVLAAILIFIIALAVILIVTCSPNRLGENEVADPTPSASPTADPYAPVVTPDLSTYAPADETPDPTPDPTPIPTATPPATPSPDPTPDSSVMQTPSPEMVEKAVAGALVKGNVNMREGPGKNFKTIATGLKNGSKLTAFAKFDEWYFVKINDKYGYILDEFIKLDKALDPEFIFVERPEGSIEGAVNASTVVLRSAPNKDDDNNKIRNYPNGTKVFIFYRENDFYYVLIAGSNNVRGYIWAEFVKANGVVPNKP
ncbi:MAG: SH3 domain-containing protein [Clostridiales bacterium]|nr:SH3 domain-containing protein [Clostridiales bacterium]